MRRDKAPLLLLEQLVTLLVFALAAAICLQVFVKARLQSQAIADQDQAALLCQNTAETLQATGGDVERTLTLVSGAAPGYRDGFGHFVAYGKDWQPLTDDGRPTTSRYTLQVQTLDSDLPGLGRARVEAYVWKNGEMRSLFALDTAWQEEVAPHG